VDNWMHQTISTIYTHGYKNILSGTYTPGTSTRKSLAAEFNRRIQRNESHYANYIDK